MPRVLATIKTITGYKTLTFFPEDATEAILNLEGEASTNAIVTTVIIALGLILMIGVIFGMAIFFDHRNK